MSSGGGLPLIALEIVLGFGVPVAWGVWQLIDLRRYREADAREKAAREAAEAATTGAPREGPPGAPQPPAGANEPR